MHDDFDNAWVHLRDGRIRRITRQDIAWIEAASNYVDLHLPDETLTLRGTLAQLSLDLGTGFLRTHRRFLVNRNYIRELRSVQGRIRVVLTCDAELPVGRHYLRQVFHSLAIDDLSSKHHRKA